MSKVTLVTYFEGWSVASHCCASDVRKSQIPGRSTVMAELERNSYIATSSQEAGRYTTI